MTVEQTGKPVYKLSYMQMSYMHSEYWKIKWINDTEALASQK
jgi:hypothetical protein